MRLPRVPLVFGALLLLAASVGCSSDDGRPAYAYSADPAPRSSASKARLPAPSRRVVASPYVPPPTSPRRGST